MGQTMCPGQDTAFWKPGDIFEVECASCGHELEFFKDDASRRCRKCGAKVANPRLNLGCAQWCEHAKECLGYDPKEVLAAEGDDTSLVDRLIEAMKRHFGRDQKRITHALRVLEGAKAIMKVEGGDPKVILSAAVLHDVGIPAAEAKYGSAAGRHQEELGPPIAEAMMKELGLDLDTIDRVSQIIARHHRGGLDSLEFKVIWDADWLVNLPDEFPRDDEPARKARIEKVFRTAAGKALAKREHLPRETTTSAA